MLSKGKDGEGVPSEWSYETEVPPFTSDKQTSELRTRDEGGHFTLTNEQSIHQGEERKFLETMDKD